MNKQNNKRIKTTLILYILYIKIDPPPFLITISNLSFNLLLINLYLIHLQINQVEIAIFAFHQTSPFVLSSSFFCIFSVLKVNWKNSNFTNLIKKKKKNLDKEEEACFLFISKLINKFLLKVLCWDWFLFLFCFICILFFVF